MIGCSEFLERTVSTRRHDTVCPGETIMSFLATIAVNHFRGNSSFATISVIALSFALSSFTALETFDGDLGSVHRLGVRFSFPLSLGIGESGLLGGVFSIGVLKPTS